MNLQSSHLEHFTGLINEFVERHTVGSGKVVSFAEGGLNFQTIHYCSSKVFNVNRLLAKSSVSRHDRDGPTAQEANEPNHVSIAFGAIDHRWAQDRVIKIRIDDRAFGRKLSDFVHRVQRREDAG